MTRRTPALAITGALAITVALSGCSGSGESGGSSPAATAGESSVETIDSGTLTIGIDLTYPPYDALEDGEPAGFDVDFMNEVAERLGLEPAYIDTRFAQIIAGIKSNRYDVIASTLYISAERAEEVDFVPYFQTGNSIISLTDGEQYKTAESLCGKTVGVVTATVIADRLANAESDACKANGEGAITVKEFPTDPEATQALFARQVDAQMTDGAVAKSAVDKSNGRVAITSTELIYPVAVGIGVQKDDAEMFDAVAEAIESMKADGVYNELLAGYNLEPVDDQVLDASLAGE